VIKLPWLTALRVATLVALAASAALLSDYLAGAPSFCSAASGCGAVRASGVGNVRIGELFVPLPAFGVLGFALQLAASLWSRRATPIVASVGGAIGLYLLALQAFVIQRFCWLCVTTDLSALVALGCALAARRPPSGDAREPLAKWAWLSIGALAVAAPIVWPSVKLAPPVPASVQALYRPGKINVVEFADFQCPACRLFSGILAQALAPYGERVHFVRLNKPLSAHEFAPGAARAAICAEAQHKGEPMAEALFVTEDLTAQGIARLAERLGLEPRAFEACLADPATAARVERESGSLMPPEFEGLPTTYIGGKRLLGVQSLETVNDALERAARGEGSRGISAYVYVPIVLLLMLGIARVGGRRALT
jgi:protein-disulfide isomerase